LNLLTNRRVGGLFKARWFPIVPQLIMLTVFILLIAGGLGVTTDDPDCVQWLRNTNLSNLVVWSYWWPVIIVTAVLLGRVWCTVCPMELITYWAGRVGLRLPAPRLLQSGWVVTLFYTLIWIVGMQTLAVNRIPHQMALYLLLLMILAVDVSLIFRMRAFCSYVCPVGHLLGVYAMLSPLKWRVDDASVCRSCQTKECIARKNHERLIGRSCTSHLYPAAIQDNRDCLMCTQCLKSCPHENLSFSFRRPFADLFSDVDLQPPQVGFILMLGGFVVYEILSEWSTSFEIMMWLPYRLTDALGITGSISNGVAATIMFVVLPVLVLRMVAALAQWASGRGTAPFWTTAQTFTLLLLPTIAGAHIIKSLLKMSSRVPYWHSVLADPKGIETAQRLTAGTLVLNTSVTEILNPAVHFAAIALMLLALIATGLIFHRSAAVQKHSPGVKVVLLLSVLAYWGIFGMTILTWKF